MIRAGRAPLGLVLSVVILVAPVARPTTGWASAEGVVTGVARGQDGQPLGDVHVRISDTSFGALTGADGRFTITRVPPGRYDLRATRLGFEDYRVSITVTAGAELSIEITLADRTVMQVRPIEITGVRKPVDPTITDTRQHYNPKDDSAPPPPDIPTAISRLAGAAMQAGQLHIRGSRSDELVTMIDGVRIDDPLYGSAASVAMSSISELEVITGGMDAEYGHAQAGIVNISTPEGGDTFDGHLEYTTDRYGAPDKTFTNFDRLSLSGGGPGPRKDITWFLSFQGSFEDGTLKTSERRPRHTILDFIKVGPRQLNELNAQGKAVWKRPGGARLTAEVLRTSKSSDIYSHVFSRDGFVQTRFDTLTSTGGIVPRYGRFSADQEDSTFVPYNAAEHTPDVKDDFSQLKLVWNQPLGRAGFYAVKVSRTRFDYDARVQGEMPWEYVGQYPDQWRDQINFGTSRFFATNGDYPRLTERHTATWTVRTDWTMKTGRHTLKSGLEAIYNDLSYLSIDLPLALNADGGFGLFRNQYHYYNPEGSFYVQDRWEHEGMVINAGARLDLFSVGSQLDVSEVTHRVRRDLSPRLGIAYPVSDRDVISFHYGRFGQVPSRASIFENRGSTTQVRGNPNLENETTVAYQAALQHMFADKVFGQFAVYFKDIFGLLSIDQATSGDNPGLVSSWVNRDYASARGFEVTLKKQFSHGFGADLAYGYSVATGVASDPNQRRTERLLYLPISEQPLNWDQRHTLSASVLWSQPEEWRVSLAWAYGSGFPFTPARRSERRVDPSLTNSGRLPSMTNLDLQAEKLYSFWGRDVKLFVRANNLLDARSIANLEPDNWPYPPGSNVTDYRVYYTETGRAGGAYLGPDDNGDGVEDWVPVNDPRVFTPGRTIRVGLGVRL